MPLRFDVPYRPCLIALTLILAACSQAPASTGNAPASITDAHGQVEVPAGSPLRKELKIQTVASREQPQWLAAPAVIEVDPSHTVSVLPPVTGRVVALQVSLGQHVQRGQLLALIASGDGAQAQTDVIKARAALDLAEQAQTRAEAVLQAGGAAGKDLQSARNDAAQARAELQRAQQRWQALGGAIAASGALEVRAPITGTITTLSTAAGSYANDATVPLMTLAQLDPLWATAQVDEDQIGKVTVGDAATITLPAYPQRQWRGKVQVIGSMLDADSRRDSVRITLPNPDGVLKPNMFANAQIAAAMPASLFVPASALLMNNDAISVFVEVSPWHFQRRMLKVGEDEANEVRVLQGLQPGDKVVVAGGVLLND